MNIANTTVMQNLCTGCGVCKGICPKNSISWQFSQGLYLPVIDRESCIQCGLCLSVCPGLGHRYETKQTAAETVTGPVLVTFNAWSRDPELRHVSASGGVVSTIIRDLLASNAYDGAFCLDSYDYRSQLKTRLYTPEEVANCWNQSNAPKSRYLPVSHEDAVTYMRKNRDAKLILVATSCGIRGLLAAMEKLKLHRENYLLIGLFCDKVFNYNVLPYFQDAYAGGGTLKALHFKNKESGGWPGDMKLFPENGEAFYIPLAERAKAKAYFMPERCLYCVDKLNVCADLSVGDNYTGRDESPLGSNSVIIRTKAGAQAWQSAKEQLEISSLELADIQKAQAVDWRLDNLYYGDLKAARIGKELNLNPGVPREKNLENFERSYRHALRQLQAGAAYDVDPMRIKKQIRQDHKKTNLLIRVVRRVLRYIKRKLK